MVSFFREKSFAAIFWLIALSLLLHARLLVHAPEFTALPGDGFLFDLINPLRQLPPLARVFLYQAIVIIQALRLNYFLNDLRMMQKTATTVAMSYILITALFPAWNDLIPALLVNSILIWLIYLVSKLYNAPNPKTVIYNIGLITGSTVLLYPPSVPLVMVIFLAQAILRPFRPNEWLVMLLGLLTPVYCLVSILFLKDALGRTWQYLPVFQLHLPENTYRLPMIYTTATLGLLMIAGLFYWEKKMGRMVIQARKNWWVLLLMFLFLVPIVFFIKGAGFEVLLLSAPPAAAFVSNLFLYPEKRWLPLLMFWLTAGIIFYNNWVFKN